MAHPATDKVCFSTAGSLSLSYIIPQITVGAEDYAMQRGHDSPEVQRAGNSLHPPLNKPACTDTQRGATGVSVSHSAEGPGQNKLPHLGPASDHTGNPVVSRT